MIIQKYVDSDFLDLSLWWKKHSHPVMEKSILPFGIVAYENENKVAMSFIYIMDKCDVAQIAWTTTNPEMSSRKRHKAVHLLMDASFSYINSLGIKNIMCFTDSNGIAKILNKKGLRLGNLHNLCIGSV